MGKERARPRGSCRPRGVWRSANALTSHPQGRGGEGRRQLPRRGPLERTACIARRRRDVSAAFHRVASGLSGCSEESTPSLLDSTRPRSCWGNDQRGGCEDESTTSGQRSFPAPGPRARKLGQRGRALRVESDPATRALWRADDPRPLGPSWRATLGTIVRRDWEESWETAADPEPAVGSGTQAPRVVADGPVQVAHARGTVMRCAFVRAPGLRRSHCEALQASTPPALRPLRQPVLEANHAAW